jgi:hypothetical protein
MRLDARDGRERHLGAAARRHVKAGKRLRIGDRTRFPFQDDAVLVGLSENGRNDPLSESIVERGIDASRGDANACSGIAIDVHGQAMRIRQHISGDIAQSAFVAQRGPEPGRPQVERRLVCAAQHEAIGIGATFGVDRQILDRLEKNRIPAICRAALRRRAMTTS